MDEYVEVELEVPKDQLLTLCIMAHERDITLNSLMNDILRIGLEESCQETSAQTDAAE